MKLKRAIAAIVLVSAFAAPVTAGPFEDAVDAHARGDYAKALRLIRPLANDGDATAQYNLALMYMTGRGVQQDYTTAAIWFRKAAEQGYAFAQSNLGTLYRDGRGVPENDAEAVVWFRKAADRGDPVAQFLLGGQYATGQGVARDYAEALLWFQKAAEQGHPAARFYLGVMYAKGDGVPQDYVRSHMWFSLSAAQGPTWVARPPSSLRATTILSRLRSRPSSIFAPRAATRRISLRTAIAFDFEPTRATADTLPDRWRRLSGSAIACSCYVDRGSAAMGSGHDCSSHVDRRRPAIALALRLRNSRALWAARN
jgi:hypothetical protein